LGIFRHYSQSIAPKDLRETSCEVLCLGIFVWRHYVNVNCHDVVPLTASLVTANGIRKRGTREQQGESNKNQSFSELSDAKTAYDCHDDFVNEI